MTDFGIGGSIARAPVNAQRLPILQLLIVAVQMAAGGALLAGFSTLQESAKADIGLTDAQLSLVQGLAISIPIALFQTPLGRLADRTNRVRLVALMALSWTLGTFLTTYANSFTVLFAARTLVGLGSACSIPISISLVADMCLPEKRGRALLIPTVGRWFGAAAAFAFTGWLFGVLSRSDLAGSFSGLVPWRAAHLVLALTSLALMLPLFLLREPGRREQEIAQASLRQVWGELRRRRAFLVPLFIGYTAALMAETGASIWASPLLTRQYGQSPAEFGGWMGLIVFGTGVIGTIAGGFLADISQRWTRRRLLLPAVLAVGISIPASLFAVAPDTMLFGVMLGILLFCGAIIALVTTAAISILLPNELRGVTIGATLTIAGVIGFGIAPTMVIGFSALMGGEQHLGAALAITTVGANLISLLAYVIAIFNVPAPLAIAK